MMIPVRCFSCGKPIGHLWAKYKEAVDKGENPDKALTELGLERYCCRRMIISHRDFMTEILKYKTTAGP
jgi:DNA-directed RNA polymerase subunit N